MRTMPGGTRWKTIRETSTLPMQVVCADGGRRKFPAMQSGEDLLVSPKLFEMMDSPRSSTERSHSE